MYIVMDLNDVVSSTKIIKKQRGRPRKNGLLTIKKNKAEKKSHIEYEKELILHLPISLKDVDTTDNKLEKSSSKHESDDEISNESSNETSSSTTECHKLTYNEVIKALHEKDKVINNLRGKLGTIYDDPCTLSKDVKIYSIDLKLDKDKSGNVIIPKKTNIVCWWDTYPFDGEPFFIPERFYDGKFYVFGCFCSVNCAAAYNLSINDYKFTDRHSLLKWMYNIPPTCNIYVPKSPVPILDKFGGNITIDEYRKNNYSCNKEYRLLMPPMIAIVPFVEESPYDKTKNINNMAIENKKKANKSVFGMMKLKVKNT